MRLLRDLLALALIIALAVGAALASRGLAQSVTLAGAGSARLSTASAALMERLEAPVEVTVALPPEAALRGHVERLEDRYREAYPDFEVRIVDPADTRDEIRELGLRRTGEGLVRYGDRSEHFLAPSEARISAALERLLRRDEHYIAWLTGHGERGLQGDSARDLGLLGRALENKGYRLQPLSLARTPIIPDNTAVLVVASPQADLRPGEQALLRDFIDRRGSVLWLADGVGASGLESMLPVTPRPGVVLDPDVETLLASDDQRLLLLDPDTRHSVGEHLTEPLLLHGARALDYREGSDWTLRSLLRSPARHQLAASAEPAAEGEEPLTEGDFHLGLTLERGADDRAQRAAVLGDGDLLANSHIGNGGNLRFGLALVDWLAGADDFVGRYTVTAADQRLRLNTAGAAGLAFSVLIAVPGLFLAGAALAWRRQRHG